MNLCHQTAHIEQWHCSGSYHGGSDAHMFPGFHTPALRKLFFPKPQLFFSHASAEVRGENTQGRKFASTKDQTRNHPVTSPTCSSLSLQGGAQWPTCYQTVLGFNKH